MLSAGFFLRIPSSSSSPSSRFQGVCNEFLLTYFLFSAYALLYMVLTATILKIKIFPTIDRITYVDAVVRWTITDSLQYDMLFASIIFATALLLSFRKKISVSFSVMLLVPVISASFFDFFLEVSQMVFIFSMPTALTLFLVGYYLSNYSQKKKKKSSSSLEKPEEVATGHSFRHALSVFFSVILLVELAAALRWVLTPVVLELPKNHWSWNIVSLENSVFYVLGLMVPSIFLLCILSFLIKPFVQKIYSGISSGGGNNGKDGSGTTTDTAITQQQQPQRRRHSDDLDGKSPTANGQKSLKITNLKNTAPSSCSQKLILMAVRETLP